MFKRLSVPAILLAVLLAGADIALAATDSQSVNVIINDVNRPPQLASIGDRMIENQELLEFAITASDDDEGDILVLSADNLPAGAVFNPVSGIFSWKPDASQIGIYEGIHFEVTDGKLINTQNIIITVIKKADIVSPSTTDTYDSLWYNTNFVIYLNAADNDSGVQDSYYKINNGDIFSVKTSGQPLISVEGANNILEYWSVDKAGNVELPHKVKEGIKLDKTPPLIKDINPKEESAFEQSPVTVSGIVSDNLSGVEYVEVNSAGKVYSQATDTGGNFSISEVEIEEGSNKIKINVKDKAGNQSSENINVFLGWVMHLNIPYYNKTEDYYGAAASAQMILNYIRNGVIDLKTNALSVELAQPDIYNYGHKYNLAENFSLKEMDAQSVCYSLGHFDPYDSLDSTGYGDAYRAYNFDVEAFANDKFLYSLRDIIHWMAYPVKIGQWWKEGELTVWPNTPAAVPAYGSYEHWIVVNGAATSANPIPKPYTDPWYTPNFTVYGLWLTDPAVFGIGQDLYITPSDLEGTIFMPLNSSDKYNGKYIHVAEPPDVASTAQIDTAKEKINEETLRVIEIAQDINQKKNQQGSELDKRLEAISKHVYDSALVVSLNTDARYSHKPRQEQDTARLLSSVFRSGQQSCIELDWKKIVDATLLTDENFRKAFNNSQARSFFKVRRLDKENSFYYLIPFDKYVKGRFLTYAAIIIDAQDGSFKEASWVEEPARFVQIDSSKALALLLSYEPLLESKKALVELVWDPRQGLSASPFYPYWRISLPQGVYYVTQDEKLIKEVMKDE